MKIVGFMSNALCVAPPPLLGRIPQLTSLCALCRKPRQDATARLAAKRWKSCVKKAAPDSLSPPQPPSFLSKRASSIQFEEPSSSSTSSSTTASSSSTAADSLLKSSFSSELDVSYRKFPLALTAKTDGRLRLHTAATAKE